MEITNLSRIDIELKLILTLTYINLFGQEWSRNDCGNVGMDMEQQKQNSSSYSAQQLSYDGAYSRPKTSLFQMGGL